MNTNGNGVRVRVRVKVRVVMCVQLTQIETAIVAAAVASMILYASVTFGSYTRTFCLSIAIL